MTRDMKQGRIYARNCRVEFGRRLREWRKSNDMSQTEVGVLTNMSVTMISGIEHGRTASFDTMLAISFVLRIPLDLAVATTPIDPWAVHGMWFSPKKLLKSPRQ